MGTLRTGICVSDFLLFSHIFLSLDGKKLSNFSKLLVLNAKFTIIQTKTFGNWKFGTIGVLVNFTIPKLKFCKIMLAFL